MSHFANSQSFASRTDQSLLLKAASKLVCEAGKLGTAGPGLGQARHQQRLCSYRHSRIDLIGPVELIGSGNAPHLAMHSPVRGWHSTCRLRAGSSNERLGMKYRSRARWLEILPRIPTSNRHRAGQVHVAPRSRGAGLRQEGGSEGCTPKRPGFHRHGTLHFPVPLLHKTGKIALRLAEQQIQMLIHHRGQDRPGCSHCQGAHHQRHGREHQYRAGHVPSK